MRLYESALRLGARTLQKQATVLSVSLLDLETSSAQSKLRDAELRLRMEGRMGALPSIQSIVTSGEQPLWPAKPSNTSRSYRQYTVRKCGGTRGRGSAQRTYQAVDDFESSAANVFCSRRTGRFDHLSSLTLLSSKRSSFFLNVSTRARKRAA
jgi:hypothetical protein